MTEPHPLFAGHPQHQWVGPLAKLLPELKRRAYKLGPDKSDADREADQDWAWVVLRGGAIVGYRVRSDMYMRGELRIARAEALTNQTKWLAELKTFMQHFALDLVDGTQTALTPQTFYLQPPHKNDKGKTAARFIQLRVGEVKPGRALCWACAQAGKNVEVEWWAAGGVGGQRCEPCARKPVLTADAPWLT